MTTAAIVLLISALGIGSYLAARQRRINQLADQLNKDFFQVDADGIVTLADPTPAPVGLPKKQDFKRVNRVEGLTYTAIGAIEIMAIGKQALEETGEGLIKESIKGGFKELVNHHRYGGSIEELSDTAILMKLGLQEIGGVFPEVVDKLDDGVLFGSVNLISAGLPKVMKAFLAEYLVSMEAVIKEASTSIYTYSAERMSTEALESNIDKFKPEMIFDEVLQGVGIDLSKDAIDSITDGFSKIPFATLAFGSYKFWRRSQAAVTAKRNFQLTGVEMGSKFSGSIVGGAIGSLAGPIGITFGAAAGAILAGKLGNKFNRRHFAKACEDLERKLKALGETFQPYAGCCNFILTAEQAYHSALEKIGRSTTYRNGIGKIERMLTDKVASQRRRAADEMAAGYSDTQRVAKTLWPDLDYMPILLLRKRHLPSSPLDQKVQRIVGSLSTLKENGETEKIGYFVYKNPEFHPLYKRVPSLVKKVSRAEDDLRDPALKKEIKRTGKKVKNAEKAAHTAYRKAEKEAKEINMPLKPYESFFEMAPA